MNPTSRGYYIFQQLMSKWNTHSTANSVLYKSSNLRDSHEERNIAMSTSSQISKVD